MKIIMFILTLSTVLNAQFKVDKIDSESILGFNEETFGYYPGIRYNRVEGLFLGAGIKYTPSFLYDVMFNIEGGYGISNEGWRYKVTIYKDFFEFNKLRIGAEAFHQTSSLDDWYIGSIENSLSALVFKEDFKNYYSTQGMKVVVRKTVLDNQVQLGLEIANYDYESMARATNRAVFRKNHDFPDNPLVAEGNETSVKFIFAFDKRDNPIFPLSGWSLDGIYENTSGDFDTQGLFLILKNYIPSFGAQRVRTRTMIGTRVGSETEQHTFDLGGLGTIPGFKNKEYQNGNRFFLFSIHYMFGGDILRRIPLSFVPLYDALTLSLFADAGWLRLEANEKYDAFKGFDKLSVRQIKNDIGLSLSVSEEMLSLRFAKRTDRGDDAWRILLRLMYKF